MAGGKFSTKNMTRFGVTSEGWLVFAAVLIPNGKKDTWKSGKLNKTFKH